MPTAYILMRCDEGAENKIIRNLIGTDTISEIQPTIGHYDLIAKITSPSIDHMNEIIGEIHKDEKVRSTKVLQMNE